MTASTPVAKRSLPTGAIISIVAGGVVLVLVVFAGVVAFTLIRSTMRLTVPGASMEPAIRAGQTVSATRVDPGKYQPKRGDIVIFTAPVTWTAKSGEMFVKRVIGLPGERVASVTPKAACISTRRLSPSHTSRRALHRAGRPLTSKCPTAAFGSWATTESSPATRSFPSKTAAT